MLENEEYKPKALVNAIFIEEGKLEQGDLILFGITSTLRDRNSVPSVDGHYPIAVGEMKNKGYVDRFDLFYVLSALDAISKRCNVTIIKFNLIKKIEAKTNSKLSPTINNNIKKVNINKYIKNPNLRAAFSIHPLWLHGWLPRRSSQIHDAAARRSNRPGWNLLHR